jgi:hypothetical protein
LSSVRLARATLDWFLLRPDAEVYSEPRESLTIALASRTAHRVVDRCPEERVVRTSGLRAGVLLIAFLASGCGAAVGSSAPGQPTGGPTPPATSAPTAPASVLPTDLPTDVPTLTPVLGGPCPDLATLSIHDLQASDSACFQGDITLRGWLDRPPNLGFEGPPITPAWLYYPTDIAHTLWSEKPVGTDDHLCPESSPECAWIFLHVAPGSGVKLGDAIRWVEIVGHLHDPAALTCDYDVAAYPSNNPWGPPPASNESLTAQCDQNFVVTSIRDISPP